MQCLKFAEKKLEIFLYQKNPESSSKSSCPLNLQTIFYHLKRFNQILHRQCPPSLENLIFARLGTYFMKVKSQDHFKPLKCWVFISFLFRVLHENYFLDSLDVVDFLKRCVFSVSISNFTQTILGLYWSFICAKLYSNELKLRYLHS